MKQSRRAVQSKSAVPVAELLRQALELHQRGQLEPAQAAYRQVLDRTPGDPLATHYLGVIAYQRGELDAAIRLMTASIQASPAVADFHNNLGAALRDAQCTDGAIAAFRRAIELKADFAEAHNNLGDALRLTGQLDAAVAHCRRAATLRPTSAEAHNNLAAAMLAKGKPADAIASARRAIQLKPDYATAHVNLGHALRQTGATDDAVAAYQTAMRLQPAALDAPAALADLYHHAGRTADAVAAHRAIVALRPDDADCHCNLGGALVAHGDPAGAVAAFDRAIAIDPGHAAAHWNKSLELLKLGDFARGWDEYEWRWRCPAFPSPLRTFAGIPAWDGSDPAGRTILVHAEQGCGDAIQFARYVPMLAGRGARVVIECQPELTTLLSTVPGAARVVPRGHDLGPFDAHVPMLSLPRLFRTRAESIPAAAVPYVHPDAARRAEWTSRLARADGRMKIGLVWAGSPGHGNDRNRSCGLPALAPLADVPGVALYGLQKGPAASDLARHAVGSSITDLSPYLRDFSDTAAALGALDLLIAVDTSVLHLAGALGRPAWGLIPFVPDWRWMLARDDSPWYPSMRLFRQNAPGDWAPVVARIASALARSDDARSVAA